MRLFYVAAVAGLCLAQISSYLVDGRLGIGRSHQILGPIHFTHVRNHGGIFGIFQGHGWLFAGISFVILALVVFWVHRVHFNHRLEYLCFGLVVGGGASNILDRMVYGSVVDFIDIHGIPYWNYIFNTADVMIHMGIWPLFIFGFLAGKTSTKDQADPSDTPETVQ